jgi:hypothetical protein
VVEQPLWTSGSLAQSGRFTGADVRPFQRRTVYCARTVQPLQLVCSPGRNYLHGVRRNLSWCGATDNMSLLSNYSSVESDSYFVRVEALYCILQDNFPWDLALTGML